MNREFEKFWKEYTFDSDNIFVKADCMAAWQACAERIIKRLEECEPQTVHSSAACGDIIKISFAIPQGLIDSIKIEFLNK